MNAISKKKKNFCAQRAAVKFSDSWNLNSQVMNPNDD